MTVAIAPAYRADCAGAIIYVYHANKGEGHPKHVHPYSHSMICHAGSCLITTPNGTETVDKYCGVISFAPDQWHDICALEDNTVFTNIFDSRNLEG